MSKTIDASRRADLAGLILGGCTILVLPLIQIGLARRWDYGAALHPYYVTLPLLGCWLAWAGIVLTLLAHPKRLLKNIPERPAARVQVSVKAAKSVSARRRRGRKGAVKSAPPQTPKLIENVSQQTPTRHGNVLSIWGAALAIAAVIAAVGFSEPLRHAETPLARRLQLIRVQRQFVDSLGAATCDLAAMHRSGPAVRWVPKYDISNCSVCQDIIGPTQFVNDLGFGQFVRIAARRNCPAADLTKILAPAWESPSAAVTDGSESEAARSFMRQYLSPDLPAVDLPAKK